MAYVEINNVRKSFGSFEALRDVSLKIEQGSFVSLLGPSGCGKTTLLRILAGLEALSAGSISIGGRFVTNIPPEQRNLAMMFQSYALFPHLTVRENVRFPLRVRKRGTRDEQDKKVKNALSLVQLDHLAERWPSQLSGGQQQRVALARAIVSDPDVLLLDEPLSNLDSRLREDMQVELIQLHQRIGVTTIFVTHDQEEALSLSNHVVLMRDGQIEQIGSPNEIYRQPQTKFASSFLGSANLIPVDLHRNAGRVWAHIEGAGRLPVDVDGSADSGTIALRQEECELRGVGGGSEALPGRVETRVFLGSRIRYVVKVGEHRFKCLAPGDSAFVPGDEVEIFVSMPIKVVV
ncbi:MULTISPECIES: ABC transporter ATP-binding protein [unclassified Chelatococcus]|uniref:ABC transporter ATP-binding protein n=1 Tax=unclassified Chelatococcus TaxID=2638111 RepID=UPI001BCDD641|nr:MULTISPECIES: ABC transporter ATP-binding protein [unclassified Chelatococcus]MBS7697443.1 ABC transporter ATP-binding protein [Chelatococcus sp. YT9]MBX3559246.1 ABC transporter ATP-binding protein [Chelatococcus sp.]